jgi:hypothetical protein
VPTRSWPSRPASCLASRTARWARSVTRIGRPPRVVCGLRAALVWSAEWLRLLQMVRDQVTLRCARGGHADPNRDHGNRAVVAQAAGCRTTGRRPARRTRGTARRPGRSGSAAAGTRPARRSSAPPSRGDGREAPALSLSLSLSLSLLESRKGLGGRFGLWVPKVGQRDIALLDARWPGPPDLSAATS